MEMTQRSEEDVCCALYECDNELDRAVIFLLEQLPINAFATTSKKKKNKNKEEKHRSESEWNESQGPHEFKDRNRARGAGNTEFKNHGNRIKDKKRNDNNESSMEFKVDTFRPANDRERNKNPRSSNIRSSNRNNTTSSRSTYRTNKARTQDHQEIDAWDASQGIMSEQNQQQITIDTWGDWDNEEYTGSLNDTKVFTPSTSISAPISGAHDIVNASNALDKQKVIKSSTHQAEPFNSIVTSPINLTSSNQKQYSDINSATTQIGRNIDVTSHQHKSLSEEQSQYFNALSSQNTHSYPQNNVQFASTFGNSNQFGSEQIIATQQTNHNRKPQKARVPPPSKIPSSAVEMPGDSINTVGYIDVQFGGLDLGNDDSLDATVEKFNSPGLDGSTVIQGKEVNDFAIKSSQKPSLSGAAQQNAHLHPSADVINQNESVSPRTPSSATGTMINNSSSSFAMNKNDNYLQSSNTNYNSSFSTASKLSYANSYGNTNFSAAQVS